LLSGFLATALLLTGLLTRLLILLARILVRIGHRVLPLLMSRAGQLGNLKLVARELSP
jgi:hypothetical protein